MVLVVAVAGLLRVAYVLAVTQHQEFHGPERPATVRSYDELWYQQVAGNLADGDGFRIHDFSGFEGETARHPPATAVALVPAALVSDDDLPMRLTVVLAGLAVVVLTAVLARRLAGDVAGLVAGSLAALHPYLWLNDGLVMAETFSSLATLAAVLATLVAVSRPTAPRALAVGATIGLAALTRGELLLLGPALALVLVTSARSVPLPRRVALCGLATVAALAVLAPWAVHNLDRFEEPVLLSTNDGDVLVGANCDETYAGDLIGFHYGYCGLLGAPTGDESLDAVARREAALDHVADDLGRVPLVVAARVGRLAGVFQPFWLAEAAQDEGRPRTAALAGWATGLALLPAGVGGALVLRRRRAPLAAVLAPIATVVIGAAVTYGHPRFRAPAEPALVALAAVGIAAWLERDRRGGGAADDRHDPEGPRQARQA